MRFAGADVVTERASAYDAVTAYVARVAPQYLDELRTHYTVIRPSGHIGVHIVFYRQQPDKQPFIDHARRSSWWPDCRPTTSSRSFCSMCARS